MLTNAPPRAPKKDRATPIGQSIDAYLKGASQAEDHAIHLLFAANRWEASQEIRTKILEAGTTLVVDRYSYSGAVYSAAKLRPDLSLEWAWSQEVGLPRPDVVVFLTVSAGVAAKRGGFGEERYETDLMQGRVRGMFEELWRRVEGEGVVVVDADGRLEEVERRVLERVRERLASPPAASEELATLGPLKEGS